MPAPSIHRVICLPTLSLSAEITPPAGIAVTSYHIIITSGTGTPQVFAEVPFSVTTTNRHTVTRLGVCTRRAGVTISIAANHAGGQTEADTESLTATPQTSALETIRQRLAERIDAAAIPYGTDTLIVACDKFGRPATVPRDKVSTTLPHVELSIPSMTAARDPNHIEMECVFPIAVRTRIPKGDLDEGARAAQALIERVLATLANGIGLSGFGVIENCWTFQGGTPVDPLEDGRVCEVRSQIRLNRLSESVAPIY